MAIYYSDGSNSTAGRQVQVVTATSGTYTINTSNTYADLTNNHVDITPKSNGNMIIGTFCTYLNNRDNDTDSRIMFKIVEVVGGVSTDVYFPNQNEGVNSHQWISIVNGSGTTDNDMWNLHTLHWARTLPSSGRAGVSHRYKIQGAVNLADSIKTLGFTGTVREVTV